MADVFEQWADELTAEEEKKKRDVFAEWADELAPEEDRGIVDVVKRVGQAARKGTADIAAGLAATARHRKEPARVQDLTHRQRMELNLLTDEATSDEDYKRIRREYLENLPTLNSGLRDTTNLPNLISGLRNLTNVVNLISSVRSLEPITTLISGIRDLNELATLLSNARTKEDLAVLLSGMKNGTGVATLVSGEDEDLGRCT